MHFFDVSGIAPRHLQLGVYLFSERATSIIVDIGTCQQWKIFLSVGKIVLPFETPPVTES